MVNTGCCWFRADGSWSQENTKKDVGRGQGNQLSHRETISTKKPAGGARKSQGEAQDKR